MAVENKTKISKLLEQSSPIICSATLWNEIGRAPAIFLQKLHYWLSTESDHIGHFIDGRRWIYNSHQDWTESLGIYCAKTIYRAIKKLEEIGIISSRKINAKKGKHLKAYTINYNVLNTLFPWLAHETSDVDIFRNTQINQINSQENVENSNGQNVQIINGKHRCTNITSITSGEEVANKPVKQPYAKPPRKETISKSEIKESRLTESNQVIYKLVDIYSKHIGGEKVTLNKRLAKWLMAAFQKLGSCLKKWENFCKRIATSDWLMGRITNGFKASLSWLLRFEVMDRILGGGFKCKEPYEEVPMPTQEDERDIIKQIENSELSSEEKSIKKTLLKTFGVALFRSWLNETKIKLEEGKTIILTKSLFCKDYIEEIMWGKIMALYPNALIKVETNRLY